MKYDVFNGDADGLCALQQIRLNEPAETALVTGVKRNISLVTNIEARQGDEILVLDVSLAKNTDAVLSALASGAVVHYFDHHFPGDIPLHVNFHSHIDTSPDICTSLIVNQYLENKYARWAVAGAFGDNMDSSATKLAVQIDLVADEITQLKMLGIYLNYNGYGSSLEDLYFHPDDLFRKLQAYADPRDFIHNEAAYSQLKAGYEDDMQHGLGIVPEIETGQNAVLMLPDQKWARRVSGVLGNELANRNPQRAHALITEKSDGTFQVSVRAPQVRKENADVLCMEFPTGGGRKGAAGINKLEKSDLEHFISRFQAIYS